MFIGRGKGTDRGKGIGKGKGIGRGKGTGRGKGIGSNQLRLAATLKGALVSVRNAATSALVLFYHTSTIPLSYLDRTTASNDKDSNEKSDNNKSDNNKSAT
jgi:hypothetical protein